MAVGLLLATGAFYWSALRALQESVSPAVLRTDLLLVLVSIVVAGTAATLMGAWRFTSSAVRPVSEITAQATRIEAGTLDQRIQAHADTEEYEGLVAVLNRMLERLERGFAAQRRLTADVSHELRTPLTALRGEIEVALRAPRSQREYEHVLRSDIARLVGDRLDRLRRRFEERNLAVDRSLRAAQPGVLIDPELIGRLVDHLLENALQFTPVGGTIKVQLDPLPGDGVRLAVENSGPGIAAADLPHLFEPFYRSDPARTRTQDGGSGIGLALVASIAHLHGGLARASSGAGQQTRFEVDIPAPPAN